MIIGDRATIASSGPLDGRTGTLQRHTGSNIWTVDLDPSTDPIPGDYYPRGGIVSVYRDALTVIS